MKKIAMYDLEGYLLEVFKVKTYIELEDKLGIDLGGLNSYFSNRQNQVNNRQFRELHINRVALKKISDVSMLVNSSMKYKVVLKLYKGRLICSYNSISEAAEKNNLNPTSLRDCIVLSKSKILGDFEWKYAI